MRQFDTQITKKLMINQTNITIIQKLANQLKLVTIMCCIDKRKKTNSPCVCERNLRAESERWQAAPSSNQF